MQSKAAATLFEIAATPSVPIEAGAAPELGSSGPQLAADPGAEDADSGSAGKDGHPGSSATDAPREAAVDRTPISGESRAQTYPRSP